MSLVSVLLPAAAVRWRLDGPPGPGTDTLVASLIGAGVNVEPITAGAAYRLEGSHVTLQALSEELAGIEGYSLGLEQAPASGAVSLSTERTPPFPFVRTVTLHGPAASWVARAVDARLQVSTVGLSRWSVAGRTAALVEWLAAEWSKSADEVCTALGIPPESVAAEDSPPATVSVALPTRKTVSEITRNEAGGIVSISQIESTP